MEYTKKALEMRENLYSSNHPDIAQSLNDLAVSYSRLGDDISSPNLPYETAMVDFHLYF